MVDVRGGLDITPSDDIGARPGSVSRRLLRLPSRSSSLLRVALPLSCLRYSVRCRLGAIR